MSFTSRRQFAAVVLLLSSVAFGQINIDTQVKGSRWPAAGTESGSGNAYAVTTFASLGPTLRTNSRIEFIATHANTGAATLAVDGGSAIPIKKAVSTALASGDIANGAIVIVIYDGTNFQCTTCGTSGGSAAYRTCSIIIGADNASSALANNDLAPQGRQCFIPAASTVVQITVAADAGTPNVVIAKNHAGSLTDQLSSALATAGSGGIACSNTGGTTGLDGVTTCSATLQNTSLAAGDYLETHTATAGGTAKRMSIFVSYTVN